MTSTKCLDQSTRRVQILANFGKFVLVHRNLGQMSAIFVRVFHIQKRPFLAILVMIVGGKNKAISDDCERMGKRGRGIGHFKQTVKYTRNRKTTGILK